MIYNKKYVKELIRKQLMDELTVKELKDYNAAKMLYTEEELDRMIAEVLLTNKDKLKEDELARWKPDFEAIRAGKKQLTGKKKRRMNLYWWACGLAVFCLGMGILYQNVKPKKEFYFVDGACAGLSLDTEVPTEESAATLSWGDSSQMYVDSGVQGQLLRDGALQVRKKANGVLELELLAQVTRREKTELRVATGAKEQCVLMLPDSTFVRLQAQTVFHYRATENGGTELAIRGQAYIKRSAKEQHSPLLIHTFNARLASFGGDFMVQAEENWTKTALGEGRMKLYANRGNKEQLLDRYGAEAYVLGVKHKISGEEKDSLIYNPNSGNYADALRWTKAVREFKNIPLRDFTQEMGKWYGFEVVNYACIPAGKNITTTICYREGKEAVFAAIRTAGILLYEAGGVISFCPEDTETKSRRALVDSSMRMLADMN